MNLSVALHWRSLAVFGFDLAAVIAAWFGAFMLRFNFEGLGPYLPIANYGALLLVPVEAVVFRAAGLYRGIWVFASLPDLLRIGRAVGLSMVVIALGAVFLAPAPALPRSLLLIYPLLLVAIMGGGRAAYRVFKEHREFGALRGVGKPVLVLGAGREAVNLIQELRRSREWHVVGLLDDDPAKRQREVCGVRVLGSVGEIADWADALRVRHAIIAMPGANAERHRRVANLCVRAGVRVFILPAIEQLIVGHDTLSQMRSLDLEDLLGREPVEIDTPQVREMLAGRVAMVTGAGGSIGAELCRQIARFGPAQIIAFELNEFALYTLSEEFAEEFPEVGLVAIAGDVKDRRRVMEILERHAPAVVFHAAAYKHVPLMEEQNAWQAVRNNVLGTWILAQASAALGVERFVLVSTDKAVNPTNVMGASKRLAEIICQEMQRQSRRTRFEMVRFGNVLGSAGSVIPKFQAQIERGGPVTVTHPEITRYFMAIHEAAQLVLQAAAMGEGGEIFVLDMGQPVKVLDLARDMIRLSGKSESEVPIVFTGLRPGEKLFEEVLAHSERTRPTHHPKLRVARASLPDGFEMAEMLQWVRSGNTRTDDEVRRVLRRWVPEYAPYNPPKPFLVAAKMAREAC
ncbi:polysaccharide biosynthesis protein [Aromatoleum bremense]|uniref:NAD-dependent epimerase/dehydratase family protein n=1 Tax=Aromatoleum bremense TaxID=76115 RepID=A0ABX1NX05_9RHOO|nr:nucleoside-diphosphate sugar epimerase/dehydratase [Aromatoleum bremense]NMG16171.1 NAD-dependent epimerase/dehydratase family protein [Aromatoleum bremense]QTQ32610.1 putative polysaccharide biosynthesis protein [Aromatoleum bremense]